MQESWRYLVHMSSYSPFCPKFRCHGNQGGSGIKFNNTIRLKFNNTIRLAIPENPTVKPKITTLCLIHSQRYNRLKNCLIFPIGAIVNFFGFCE